MYHRVEIDQYRFALESLEAEAYLVAEAGVMQAEAALENSEANLAYTRIESPVDGIVIDRKIEPGQTLAAQFQTPELFVVAPDIRREMHIFASVDEADIGLIRAAREAKQPVEFSVDAYPDLLFEGSIEQIRLSPVVIQNVVTYPVVVSAPNPDLKLMPGMTASLSFQTDHREQCLRVPNAALRFFPDVESVREQDKHLITGIKENEAADQPDDESADEKTAAAAKRSDRYVWVWEEPLLKAIPVTIGIRDSKWSELVKGELKVGDALVVAGRSRLHEVGYTMGFWNTVRISLRSLGKNRMRAGLTTLGVVIGIAAVTAMVSIGQSAAGLVRGELEGLGTNVIIVLPKMMQRGGVQDWRTVSLTPGDAEAIELECPSVAACSGLVGFSNQVVYGGVNWQPKESLGVGPAYLTVRNWQIRHGGFFSDARNPVGR